MLGSCPNLQKEQYHAAKDIACCFAEPCCHHVAMFLRSREDGGLVKLTRENAKIHTGQGAAIKINYFSSSVLSAAIQNMSKGAMKAHLSTLF